MIYIYILSFLLARASTTRASVVTILVSGTTTSSAANPEEDSVFPVILFVSISIGSMGIATISPTGRIDISASASTIAAIP